MEDANHGTMMRGRAQLKKLSGAMGTFEAARQFNVPQTTLKRHLIREILVLFIFERKSRNFIKNTRSHFSYQSHIWNVDEIGVSTVPKKKSKMIVLKGKKGCWKRGTLATVAFCMSASGNLMQLMFIFPRKNPNNEFLDIAPPVTTAEYCESDIVLLAFDACGDHMLPTSLYASHAATGCCFDVTAEPLRQCRLLAVDSGKPEFTHMIRTYYQITFSNHLAQLKDKPMHKLKLRTREIILPSLAPVTLQSSSQEKRNSSFSIASPVDVVKISHAERNSEKCHSSGKTPVLTSTPCKD
ncbi:hypothetical protein PR048_002634 [Dryococelus australis]|uniref:HTH psq-type domain-containing protein n=1 Tax=Dryococelus australis TaxID=614101 RepID=A0ABQ9IKR6_9NEOP|nr:hypothetical protein PR048_002634 [Dryococelus australis]